MRNPQIDHLFSSLKREPAFQSLAGRLASPGSRRMRFSGLTATARAIYAALLHEETGRPQIIVTEGAKEAEALTQALRSFAEIVGIRRSPVLLPALDVLPGQGMSPHAEILSSRAIAFNRLSTGDAGIVVLPVAAMLERLRTPDYYKQLTLTLRVKDELPLDDITAHLESVGYTRRDPVEMAGEYSVRGGILDVFSPEQNEPVRVEFFGDEIESIRRFDPESQRSVLKVNECSLQPLSEFQKSRELLAELADFAREHGARPREYPAGGEPFSGWELLLPARVRYSGSALDFLENPVILMDEPELLKAAADRLWNRLSQMAPNSGLEPSTATRTWEEMLELAMACDVVEVRELEMGEPDEESFHIGTRPALAFHGNLQFAIREAKTLLESGIKLAFFAPTTGEIERLADVFSEYSLPWQMDLGGERVPEHLQARIRAESPSPVALIRGEIARGVVFPSAQLALFGAEDLFDAPETVGRPGKSHLATFSADQFDLKPGDYVVHVEHGVGQFLGLREIAQGDSRGDYMLIEYSGGNKLYVPLARMDLVQRFRGEGEAKPALDKMGGATWSRTKTRIKARMRDMAEELLKLYAARKMAKGFSFSADSNWQREFEDAFEYTETKDQKAAIVDIKRDMESPQPMDRLLCGDVGYGKTEVVMRAAFKALGDGKQVAVLAPTTVLCFQHFQTFRKRFEAFPARIEMLSRFRTAKEI